MSDQIIPLDNSPNQTFKVAVSIDGVTKTLRISLRYNEMADYWVMSIADDNGKLLLDSIPLLTGIWPAANLLAQYGYLGIGSAFILNNTGAALDFPNDTDLGSDFSLVWSDTAA